MMRKTIASLLLACMMLTPAGAAAAGPIDDGILIKKGENSDNVILLQMRLRDLGYYNYKITGYFGDFTGDALKDFQSTNGIKDDGVAGEKTLALLYNNVAKRKPVEPLSALKPAKKSTVKYGKIVDWSVINKIWKKQMKCKVIDFDTGISYYVIRVNQSYSVGHADVAPATKADTAALKATFNGEFTATRRALVVIINGERVAASLYGEPHGSTGVPGNGLNRPDGKLQQVCIHFKNSRTNIRNMIDPDHQYQIKRAAGLIK